MKRVVEMNVVKGKEGSIEAEDVPVILFCREVSGTR